MIRSFLVLAAAAFTFALAGCGSSAATSSGGGTGALTASTPTAAPAQTAAPSTAPATPQQYFADGKTYQAWILSVNADGTLTIDLVHHLTGDDAKNYLTSHGATIGPDGIPNDYINVDTSVDKTVQLSPTVKVTTNEEGGGPVTISHDEFIAWLNENHVKPIAAADRDKYVGAAKYFGPLFAVTFSADVLVSADQIFEP
jgi:hypothetical protein